MYRDRESVLRNKLTRELVRGKIEFNLWYDITEVERKATINHKVLKDYISQFQEMKSWTDVPNNDVLLPIIMKLPEVLKVERHEIDDEEWIAIMKSLEDAVASTQEFRTQEGKVLEDDIRLRINTIIILSQEIKKHLGTRLDLIKTRLEGNLNEFIGKDKIDNNRFEQEMIYYLEKLDITEEEVRLANHCSYFLETIDKEDVAGKKLGFIAQEIGREINTMGSKANNGDIQKLVVQMKDELEKIKEQLLNVL
jgi:uncharacterized protein (TIGR00255 family)